MPQAWQSFAEARINSAMRKEHVLLDHELECMRMYSSHSRLPFMCETTHKTERAARALMDKHDWTTKSPNQSMHGFLQRLDLERKHAGEGPTQTSLPYLQPRDNSLVRSHGKKVRPSVEAENVFECMVSLPSKSQFNQRRERGREHPDQVPARVEHGAALHPGEHPRVEHEDRRGG